MKNMVDWSQISKYTKMKWSESHGACQSFLGGGMLYYALVYMIKAKRIVCLGSGGGFVPSVLVQAQFDAQIQPNVVLVDANIGEWGLPDWLADDSYFKATCPYVKIIQETTEKASHHFIGGPQIDYLHIDADHSFAGSMADFKLYSPLVANNGIITMHDTNITESKMHPPSGVSTTISHILRRGDYEMVNFPMVGAGTAILRKKTI